MTRTTRLALAALVSAAILLVPGCARTSAPSSEPTATSPQPATPATIDQMSPSEKREALGSGFPIEVPVPKGAVAEASSQGSNVHVYKISVDAPTDAVAAWYREAYRVRDWTEGSSSGGAQSMRLVFSKASAQSEVRLTGAGSSTQAVVSVGIGVPVGDTY